SSDHTPTLSDLTLVLPIVDEEFEASEPSDTRITSSHSTAPSNSTTPLSPDHLLTQTSPIPTRVSYYHSTTRMVVRTQPILTPGMSARIAKAAALSPSSFRKRYQGKSELVEDIKDESSDSDTKGEGSEDEGPSSEEEEEEATPEEETPTPRPPVRATWVDTVDGTVYTDIPIYVPPVRVPVQTPPSSEWSFGALPVSPSSLAVPTPVASPADSSPVASPATVEAESFLAELGAQVELQGGLIHDHIQRLDTLPTALFEGYNQDFRELYARSRTVREEIFSQRCRLMSLEQEHERAIVTFGAIWRLVLALES
ncbi:hypothetical protein Tco_1527640, partial [Tanacetum coccineum]